MLYGDGGLTAAVEAFTSNKTTLDVADLMYELLGYKVKFSRSCSGTHWQATTSLANSVTPIGMDIGISLLGVAPPFGTVVGALIIGVSAALPFIVGFLHPCPKPIEYSDDKIDQNDDGVDSGDTSKGTQQPGNAPT